METLQYIKRKILRVDLDKIDQTQARFAPVYAKFDEEKFKGVGIAQVTLHTNVGSSSVRCALLVRRDAEQYYVASSEQNFIANITNQLQTIPAPKTKPLPSLRGIGMTPAQIPENENDLIQDIGTPVVHYPSIKAGMAPNADFLARHGK